MPAAWSGAETLNRRQLRRLLTATCQVWGRNVSLVRLCFSHVLQTLLFRRAFHFRSIGGQFHFQRALAKCHGGSCPCLNGRSRGDHSNKDIRDHSEVCWWVRCDLGTMGTPTFSSGARHTSRLARHIMCLTERRRPRTMWQHPPIAFNRAMKASFAQVAWGLASHGCLLPCLVWSSRVI